jgi:YihY family inner membrane protein
MEQPMDAIHRLDQLQQRHPFLAVPIGVWRKAGDDEMGQLVALLSYYGFLSLLPLLLVAVTVLGLVLQGHPGLQHDLLDSALAQLPIIGDQIGNSVHPLHGSRLTLVIGIVLAFWTALGAGKVAQDVMNRVWAVPKVARPGFFPKLGRAVMAVGLLGGGVLVATAVGTLAANLPQLGFASRVLVAVALAAGDSLLVLLGFKILTAERHSWRELLPGSVFAGIAFAVMQLFGSWYIARTLKNATSTYGFFGIVFALLAYLALAAQFLVYGAELNVVLHRRLWPRSIAPPPLTDADRRVLEEAAKAEERRPEQEVDVEFHDTAGRR